VLNERRLAYDGAVKIISERQSEMKAKNIIASSAGDEIQKREKERELALTKLRLAGSRQHNRQADTSLEANGRTTRRRQRGRLRELEEANVDAAKVFPAASSAVASLLGPDKSSQ